MGNGSSNDSPVHSLVPILPPPENLPTANVKLSESQLHFALNLTTSFYKYLLTKNPIPNNIVFSPLSIAVALSMTCLGASGETRKEMLNHLFSHLVKNLNTSDDSNINATTHQHMHLLCCKILNHYSAEFTMANKLVVMGLDTRPEFLANVKSFYESEVEFSGNKDTINAWAEEKTKGKVKQLLTEELPPECRLVLLNAVYFKSNWELKFKKQDTTSEPFHLECQEMQYHKDIQMMHHWNKNIAHVSNEHFEAVELMYQYKQWSLLLLLPNREKYKTISSFVNSKTVFSSSSNVNEPSTLVHQLLVNDTIAQPKLLAELAVPRFKIESESQDMNDSLKSLGMSKMFSGGFDNMAIGHPDLHVHKVVHKAVIEVNEEGTEAAAATAVLMTEQSMSLSQPPTVRFNRPFVYILRHVPSKIIAFMGVVHEPK